MARTPPNWHALQPSEALLALGGREGGLSASDAARGLRERGPNALAAPKTESLAEELLESLREPLQLLLIAVGGLSAIWGELRDAIAIFLIIGAVAAIETATEVRARRALAALRGLTTPRARAFRDGALVELAAEDLVPGDVIALEAGDTVPADGRVLDASGLQADESTLTGEPQASAKGAATVGDDAPLAARSTMVYAGTAITGGEGRAVVVATGGETEIGRLGATVAEEREPQTPLQRRMAELARAILFVAVTVSVAVPAMGVLRGQPIRQMVLAGLTLAFATIPEELPILVTVLLAIGGRRLARRGALLRKLRAGETLGAVTVVVTDKTGTLTENRLELAVIDGSEEKVLRIALACQAGTSIAVAGSDPIERALATEAQRTGLAFEGTPLRTFPFDPERKRMSRAWLRDGRTWIAVKGAPEAVLAVSSLTPSGAEAAAARAGELAGRGLRVLAFAERSAAVAPETAEEAECDLTFLGLAAFDDPMRPGVPEAVATLEGAGVQTIVVTGDHPATAAAIAGKAGLGGGETLIGGSSLRGLADSELSRRLRNHTVVARATPADKLRIVRLLQGRGEVVVVTGDGINDAPALAGADVGIAMGQRGTDLAREAADLVLTDDAYPTVAAAVEGGRTIGSQLRRAVAFYLGAKLALVGVVAVPLALGMASPFAPVHIVLLELFMDLGASTAFVSEPMAPGAMRRAPRDPASRFLDRVEKMAISGSGLAVFAGVLSAYFVVRATEGAAFGPAAAVATWLIGHTLVAWSIRAQPRLSWRSNAAFPGWVGAATLAAVVLAGTPAGHAFGLNALSAVSWAMVLGGVVLSSGLAFAIRGISDLGNRL